MSRVGKKTIVVPKGVSVTVDAGRVKIKGPKGEIERQFNPAMESSSRTGSCGSTVQRSTRRSLAAWPDRRTVGGHDYGRGRGLRKEARNRGHWLPGGVSGKALRFHLGFSHPITYEPPAG